MSDPNALVVVIGGFVFGLVLGSWLTACVHRLPRRLDLISDRSRCPSCGTEILARHNLPLVGWLVLRGHCHSCRASIPARYPLIELACGITGVILALLDWRLAVVAALALLIVPALVSLATRSPRDGAGR